MVFSRTPRRGRAWQIAIGVIAGLGLMALASAPLARLCGWTREPASTPPPADPALRARHATDAVAAGPLGGAQRSPGAADVPRLWRLASDSHHLVRGLALEALAGAGLGRDLAPERAAMLAALAATDTDFNRRSACVLLIQHDLGVAMPLAAALHVSTSNPATRRALVEALRATGSSARRRALEAAARSGDGPRRRLAGDALARERSERPSTTDVEPARP
jgi:hypothetical protein